MNFWELERRLVAHLQERVRRGDVTERGLARLSGISQPHIHNVLKGKRIFSIEAADTILSALGMDLMDLLKTEERPPKRN